jgi:hypothetical protein
LQLLQYLAENKKRAFLFGAVALLCIFALWGLLSRGSGAKVEHPDGYTFICQNPSCHNQFTVSFARADELRAKPSSGPLRCPKCGQTEVVQAGATDRRARTASR